MAGGIPDIPFRSRIKGIQAWIRYRPEFGNVGRAKIGIEQDLVRMGTNGTRMV
jgi:hypothetical protein